MKFRLILFLSLLAVSGIINAQKIDITIPKEANKEYAFILNKGIKQDTIQKGTVSFTGDITITIPQKEKDYVGMGSLQVKGRAPINMIINHESFSVTQTANSKLEFKNSKENTYLYSIIQDGLAPQKDTALYASYFIELLHYMQQLNKVASQGASLSENTNTRLYALNDLDMTRLYTSSIWFYVIDGLTKLSSNQATFGNDMVRLLKRIDNKEVFVHLSENLITITEQYGWDDAFDIIVPYIKDSGRIPVPQGNMYYAFALAKIKKGTVPPALVGLNVSLINSKASKTLLVFYQPDCDNCHAQMDLLIKDYPKLREKGVRIISISSDTDRKSYEEDMKRYPWPKEDKICDFKGFAGKNFMNYGIMSTPTFFLLDKDKKVVKRYALFTDIDFSYN